MIFFLSFIWFGYWSAESGSSLPWSRKWQKFKGLNLSQIPEIIIAISGAWLISHIKLSNGSIPTNVLAFDFAQDVLVIYAFKQAATWALLSGMLKHGYQRDDNGDGVIDYHDGRKSGIKNIVDDIAEGLKIEITDKRYGLVWAGVKGLGMTLPYGGFGALSHPLGHWLSVKLFDKLPYSNAYKEFIGGGLCFSFAALCAYLIL